MNRNVLLTTARDAINGGRNDDYGGPEDSFRVIAAFWNAFLEHRKEEGDLQPYEIAIMMDMLKTARLLHTKGQHVDSWVDKAGYSACGAECAIPDLAPDPPTFGMPLDMEPPTRPLKEPPPLVEGEPWKPGWVSHTAPDEEEGNGL